jgi:TonB family protein
MAGIPLKRALLPAIGGFPWLGDPDFRGPFGLSLAFHVALSLLFFILVFVPAGNIRYAPAYMVDLVSLPAFAPPSGGASPANASGDRSAGGPATAPPGMTRPPAAVGAPPAKAARPQPVFLPVKASSPDREELAAQDRRQKREELERSIDAQEKRIAAAQLRAALPSNLPRVSVFPPSLRPGGDPPAVARGGGTAGPAGPAGTGAGSIDLRLKSYYDRVWERIRNAWVLPEGVGASDPSLLAVVGIRILASGRIGDVWLEQGSGNIYYDQSAMRAAKKADPLPPLPAEHGGGALEVGVNFRPGE